MALFKDYSIESDGTIISKNYAKGKTCKQLTPIKIGKYLGVNIEKKIRLVHRLVALEHIPNPMNKPHVNHIDGNKFNNSVSNLEWVTPSENMIHAYSVIGIKGNKSNIGNFYGNSFNSRPIKQLNKDGVLIKEFDCIRRACHELGLSETAVCNCLNGRSKTAGNFIWKYA